MKKKLSNQFFVDFLVIFLLAVLTTTLAVPLLSFASRIASNVFAKNRYPASAIMRDDYTQIDAAPVVQSGGSVQVIDKDYRVVYSQGKDAIAKTRLTASEFTDFLVQSKSKDIPFHHDILYNEQGGFWLIVTFPASIRIDFNFVLNTEAATGDFDKAALVFAAVILMYLLFLAVLTMIYSRITALRITVPLRKLCDGTRLLREGDYSARVELRLKNEFAELQNTFNDMAERIERETALRRKSEDDRRRLILDISHDLKNPMSSIQGYAELLMKKSDMPELAVIHQNSRRANKLLTELFELSQMDSPEFSLKCAKTDLCEALRQACGVHVPQLERAGFAYAFDIPEEGAFAMLDADRFTRVIQNLMDNALRHNPAGTTVAVSLTVQDHRAVIDFRDDGHGIPAHLAKDIFKPFVRADDARNSHTGGSGLGLSIAKKIAEAHGGDLVLLGGGHKGSAFRITVPTI